MIPLSDVIASLERARAEVHVGMESAVGVLMTENAKLSKEMIGRELPIWPPLAPSTVREKEALGYVGRVSATDPLLRTGALRDSIEPVVHSGLDVIHGGVGTDVPYAAALEHGDIHMPPRPFISPPFVTMEPRAVAVLGELATKLVVPGHR